MPDITAPIVNFATDKIGAYGVIAVLILMILESACIPVPSEAIMLYGGFLVSQGDESLFLIVAAGVAGNMIGSWIAYGVGRYRGREWALRWHWLHITPKRLDSADRWFGRYGGWAVLISRCLPIIRTFISLPAGIARMAFWRFSLLTLVGCIPWVLALALAGRAVGDNWEDLQQHTLHYVDYALVLAIIAGVVYLVVRGRSRRRAAVATSGGAADEETSVPPGSKHGDHPFRTSDATLASRGERGCATNHRRFRGASEGMDGGHLERLAVSSAGA